MSFARRPNSGSIGITELGAQTQNKHVRRRGVAVPLLASQQVRCPVSAGWRTGLVCSVSAAVEVGFRQGTHEAHYRGIPPVVEATPLWTPSLEMGGASPEFRWAGLVG